jgi:hypothetical protein
VGVTGSSQRTEIGLGVALVFADQRRRKIDVFDAPGLDRGGQVQSSFAAHLAVAVDHGQRDIIEWLCPP